MKQKSNFQITGDDFKLLQFLWKWKLSTTVIINKAVFKDRSANRCYRRLRSLEENKYIESIFSRDRMVCLWQLTDKGYQELNFDGIEISQRGYKAEHPEHDFWSSLIQFGIWIDHVPKNSDLFSEQQLRRFEIESYPKWVPHTKQHRPDGWWKTDLAKSNKESLIALEVEMTRKPSSSYYEVGDFYSNVIDVQQVIWIVRSESDANFILKNMIAGSSTNASEQSFLLFSQFIKDQWSAPILIGKNKGKSIREILDSQRNNAQSLMTQHCLLDTRKTPLESTSPRLLTQIELGVSKNILG
jgi:hypothetical protein